MIEVNKFDMKRKSMFFLTFLSLTLLLTSMVYAPNGVHLIFKGPLPFRTINVDGDPGDWVGILPLIMDPKGDADFDIEDIKAVYGANDNDFLYFLMEFYEVGITANEILDGITTSMFYIDIIPGDVLVLCSDGLSEFVEDDEIAEIVNIYPPGRACQLMVNMANNRGGTDNITVLVVQSLGSSMGTSRIISGIKSLFDRIK